MVEQALKQLKARKETLQTEAEVHLLEEEVAALELCSHLVESHGEFVNPREFLFDTPGFFTPGRGSFGHQTRPDDHARGDNFPWWVTEIEIAAIRGAARIVADTDEIAISAIDNLKNYILGEEGFVFSCIPTDGDVKLAAMCQRVVDDFLEANDFNGDMDREIIERTIVDGEPFISLSEWQGGVRARIEEPDWITEPFDTRALEDFLQIGAIDWKYGIGTDIGDVTKIHGYFVQRFTPTGQDWEVFDPSRMCHFKINVGRNVKRGMSDLFSVNDNLNRAGKVVNNSAIGAAIQAGIAFIKEHAPTTSRTDVTDLRSSNETRRVRQPRHSGGSIDRSMQDVPAGRVVNIGTGSKYHSGPMGSVNGPQYIDVAQAVYRIIGSRWNMPEYMISGDASNANYASTLVSESPFVKSTSTRQGFYKRAFVNLLWRVIGIAKGMGKLPQSDSMADLRHMVEIDAKAPDISVRDKMQDHTIRRGQVDMGALSLRSFAEEAEIDFDHELELGAKPMEQGTLIQQPQTRGAAITSALESVESTEEAKAILREVYP